MADGRNREYKDLNLNFDANPITGGIPILTEEDAVKRAIRNLVLTGYYERFFRPALGSGVSHFLFENFIGSLTQERIRTAVEQVITAFEPRAELVNVEVIDDSDNNGFAVNIVFNIVSLIEPITMFVFLERVR